MVQRGKVGATFEIIKEARDLVPTCDDFFLLCSQGSAQLATLTREEGLDIAAGQYLRASKVGESQAFVLANSGALLVGIAVRILK
jgi:hypothetical protein